jgi:hypothetical protein
MLPTVEVFGVTIAEPTTTVTDYMITAVAWWCAWTHARSPDRRSPQGLWAVGFAFIGLAAFLGGTSHGAAPHLDEAQSYYLWKATVYAVGLSMLFAFAGTLEGSGLPGGARRALHALNVGAFLVYAWWMLSHSDFMYVIFHYVPAMLGVAALQAWAWLRYRAPGAPWMITGVVVTLLGAVVQQSGFALHRHFNHNDLYHVIQIAGLALLFRGSALLRPQDTPSAGTSGSRRESGLTNST